MSAACETEKPPRSRRDDPFVVVLPRYVVAVLAGALLVALPILPTLNGIVAPALIPMALGYAFVVGLPVALAVRHLRGESIGSALLGGLLAVVPVGLFSLTSGPAGPILFAVVGVIAGGGAWLVLRFQTWLTDLAPRRLALAASLGAAVATVGLAAAGAVLFVMALSGPPDRTCHNIFRNGGRSFPVVRTYSMALAPEKWPAFDLALERVTKARGWSLRDHTQDRSLGYSACQETGTNMSFRQWVWTDPPQTRVEMSVTAPQGGRAWQEPTEAFVEALEAELKREILRNDDPAVTSRLLR